VLLGGCGMVGSAPAPLAAESPRQSGAPDGLDVEPIERAPHRVGVSSSTVESLARQHACTSPQGAGQLTEEGPVEVYRMQCADGKVFMARCELRQCRKM
ncbi:hypothetical protein, partial [Achromobacter sp. GbtcB20]|uniref:hypothetical protein n=1 Tax=Achromobacter sp. GbtcB20 TaxID=2824765 RepID=UPI001C2F3BAC